MTYKDKIICFHTKSGVIVLDNSDFTEEEIEDMLGALHNLMLQGNTGAVKVHGAMRGTKSMFILNATAIDFIQVIS